MPTTKTDVHLTFTFGSDIDLNVSDVFTKELADRIKKLLTGQYLIDAKGRCILEPIGTLGPFDPNAPDPIEPRDSVCVGVNIGIFSISYCREV